MPVFRKLRRRAPKPSRDASEDPFLQATMAESPTDPRPESADYEAKPLSRQEYISAMVHLYRGELYRATVQRTRLDMTTNWAVLTTAGLLAFSFRRDSNPHWALLVGMLVVTLFLIFEARRYQMFDVWRSRVRKIEENFYGPILRRNPVSPHRDWGVKVARDLFVPSYKTGLAVALRARLLRNYWGIYLVLLLSWVLKVVIYPQEAHTWAELQANLRFGMIDWWVPLAYVASFVGGLLALILFVPSSPPADTAGEEFWVEPAVESESRPIDI